MVVQTVFERAHHTSFDRPTSGRTDGRADYHRQSLIRDARKGKKEKKRKKKRKEKERKKKQRKRVKIKCEKWKKNFTYRFWKLLTVPVRNCENDFPVFPASFASFLSSSLMPSASFLPSSPFSQREIANICEITGKRKHGKVGCNVIQLSVYITSHEAPQTSTLTLINLTMVEACKKTSHAKFQASGTAGTFVRVTMKFP